MAPGQVEQLALGSGIVHTMAIVSTLLLALGACGLTRRLAATDRLAFSGLVIYLFACGSILIAAAVSGFIVPSIMRDMVHDVGSAAPMWRIAMDAIFQINHAFARIFTVAAAVAVALWSASALRHGGLKRGIAIYGCAIAPLLIVAVSVGHLRLNVQGMAIVVVAQGIWFIVVGDELCRNQGLPVRPAAAY